MGEFKACNAFQMSEEDKKKFNELKEQFKYRIWVPESVIPVGDTYIFFDDVEDFSGHIGWDNLYRYIKYYSESVKENKIKTYTHTEEGKDVLNLLENVTLTYGMEVYKCKWCDELFGSKPEHVLYDDKVLCGICVEDLKRENRDAYGIEHLDEEE